MSFANTIAAKAIGRNTKGRRTVMPFSNRPYESDGNGAVRRFFRPPSTEYKRTPRNNSRAAKPAPPEMTNAESFYYTKQMNAKTPMVIVMTDGEQVRGWIEWYDR